MLKFIYTRKRHSKCKYKNINLHEKVFDKFVIFYGIIFPVLFTVNFSDNDWVVRKQIFLNKLIAVLKIIIKATINNHVMNIRGEAGKRKSEGGGERDREIRCGVRKYQLAIIRIRDKLSCARLLSFYSLPSLICYSRTTSNRGSNVIRSN